MIAADLEILELVKACAGRRQHDHRAIDLGGIGGGVFDGALQRAGNLVVDIRAERGRKLGGGFADQIGFGNAIVERLQAGNAAFLGQAAGDPEDLVIARQRRRRSLGIGGLGIIDEHHAALAANRLHAVLEAGK
jgi:hypothetical protein